MAEVAATPAPTVTDTVTTIVVESATVTATPTKVIATKTVQVRVTFTPPPVAMTTDGQYLVGAELKAGLWHTDDSDCYYARLRDLNGGVYSIINNGNTGPATIQVQSSDRAVEFSGGCLWEKIG